MTNTTNIARTHKPVIHAYMSILPNQPFPSVIRLSIPILFPAFSIPPTLRSRPSTARFVTSLSASTSEAIANCACLSCCDLRRRDEVKDSCSDVLFSRILAMGEVDGFVNDTVFAAVSLSDGLNLLRRAEDDDSEIVKVSSFCRSEAMSGAGRVYSGK